MADDTGTRIRKAVDALLKTKLLIGIPGDVQHVDVDGKSTVNAAIIGYINELGDPEKNIPARPFLAPGVESVQAEITKGLQAAAAAAFEGKVDAVDKAFHSVGALAVNAVQQKMTDGPFQPLSARTIEGRAKRGRKGAQQYLKLQAQGTPTDVLNEVGLVKPLIDTGALRQAVRYVIKSG